MLSLFNYANKNHPSQIPLNLRLQRIVGDQTSSVFTIFPTHRFQLYLTTPSVSNRLQDLTLHPHPQRNGWVTGCLVCGKSYDQVTEETVADFLNQTAQPCETVRERQIKRKAFIGGIQSGVFTFLPRECRQLPPVTAWSTPSITMDKTRTYRDTRCPYLKIKLTKLSLNNLLNKFPPPPFFYRIWYITI